MPHFQIWRACCWQHPLVNFANIGDGFLGIYGRLPFTLWSIALGVRIWR